MTSDGEWLQFAAHEHEWQLRAVDHEDARSVSTFECVGCRQMEFRSS